MKKKLWVVGIFVLGLAAGGGAFALGYGAFQRFAPQETQAPEVAAAEPEPVNEDVPVVSAAVPQVNADTRMIYEYLDQAAGTLESREETAPYFLLGLDREALAAYYPEWELLAFSDREVRLRYTIPDARQAQYVVGVYEDRIAVFYQEDQGTGSLYQLTDIPIDALSQEERDRLYAGIPVVGVAALNQTLEDYGS